jgi:hypothetical protein
MPEMKMILLLLGAIVLNMKKSENIYSYFKMFKFAKFYILLQKKGFIIFFKFSKESL